MRLAISMTELRFTFDDGIVSFNIVVVIFSTLISMENYRVTAIKFIQTLRFNYLS